jgi:MFS family permease
VLSDFGSSLEQLVLGQFTFLLGMSFGCLVWPSLGDIFSRKWVMVGTMAGFTAFSAGVAGANSNATAVTLRFFAGFFSSAVQVVGPATARDLFAPKDMAVPFTLAAVMPCGCLLHVALAAEER